MAQAQGSRTGDSLTLAGVFPAATEQQWRAAVDKALKGADFDKKLKSRTADGITIQPLYPRATPAITAGANSGQRWGVMTRVDHPDAAEANKLALADLEGGASGLTLVMAGALSARGYGLSCDTVAELDRALTGVELELIRIRLDPAPAGRLNATLFAALCKTRGLAASAMSVDFGVDPLGLATQRGVLPASWAETGKRLGDLVGTLRTQGFKGPVLTGDGRPYHEAGASEAEELAAVLATLVAYLRLLEAEGVSLAAARDALSAILTADADEFLTIAKFRALRRLWDRVQQASGLAPAPLTIHAETAFRMMTRRDPWVNMLRGTVAVFSAGIGGADTVTALPFTQALGLPDGFARRVARNSQHVLLEESNLWRVVDPAAGAGAFETLTDELCSKAWALFQQIEAKGGMAGALESGLVAGWCAAQRAAATKSIATRRLPITGTSEFPNLAEAPVTVLDAPKAKPPTFGKAGAKPPASAAGMIEALAGGASRADLAPAPGGAGTAVKLPSLRLAEPYEALRDRADAAAARPAIFLAPLGPLPEFGTRAMFARNLFEAGGLAAPVGDGFAAEDGRTDLSALVAAFKASGAVIACLCSSDGVYAAEAEAAAQALKAAGAKKLWLAGRPGELESALNAAGVSGYIFVGCDVLATLTEALDVRGA